MVGIRRLDGRADDVSRERRCLNSRLAAQNRAREDRGEDIARTVRATRIARVEIIDDCRAVRDRRTEKTGVKTDTRQDDRLRAEGVKAFRERRDIRLIKSL